MSGLEVFGAAASASQASVYIFEIISLIQSIREELREAPRRIQSQIELLDFLHFVVKSLEAHDLHRNNQVQNCLTRLRENITHLQKTLNHNLIYIKRKSLKRYWKAFKARKADNEVLKQFSIIESDKSNLVLYLTGTLGIDMKRIAGSNPIEVTPDTGRKREEPPQKSADSPARRNGNTRWQQDNMPPNQKHSTGDSIKIKDSAVQAVGDLSNERANMTDESGRGGSFNVHIENSGVTGNGSKTENREGNIKR